MFVHVWTCVNILYTSVCILPPSLPLSLPPSLPPLQTLMIKRELMNDPTLKEEPWDRFLPKFKSSNVQRKKPRKAKPKKPYTPFPPAPVESKVT